MHDPNPPSQPRIMRYPPTHHITNPTFLSHTPHRAFPSQNHNAPIEGWSSEGMTNGFSWRKSGRKARHRANPTQGPGPSIRGSFSAVENPAIRGNCPTQKVESHNLGESGHGDKMAAGPRTDRGRPRPVAFLCQRFCDLCLANNFPDSSRSLK